MTWTARFSAAAQRDLDRLPPKIAVAVIEFSTRTLLENPWRMSKPLQGEFDGLRSARRGDYRVLFVVDEGSDRLVIARIAHRRDAYRPPPPSGA